MATLTRISTFSQHQKLLQNVGNSQSRLAILQNQISSGKTAEKYSDLSGQVEFLGALENKVRASSQYIESNEVVKSRLKTMDVATNSLININTDLRKLIATARSVYITEKDILIQQAKSMLKNVSDQLNSSVGGRYIFAGSKIDNPPVVEDIGTNITAGIPDAAYYTGDDVILQSKVNDKFSMAYGVTANDMAFQNMIASINLTIDALNNQNADVLETSMQLANDSLQGLGRIQANINNNTVNIDNANDVHESLKLYWKGLVESQTNTDLIAASTKVAIDESILQASFQVFAKISSLRLSDYLR